MSAGKSTPKGFQNLDEFALYLTLCGRGWGKTQAAREILKNRRRAAMAAAHRQHTHEWFDEVQAFKKLTMSSSIPD